MCFKKIKISHVINYYYTSFGVSACSHQIFYYILNLYVWEIFL